MGKIKSPSKPNLTSEVDATVDIVAQEQASELVEILGQRWTLHILYSLSKGPCRFNELCRLYDINPATMQERLQTFLRLGIVVRTVVRPNPPVVHYSLTTRGWELAKVIDIIEAWQAEHLQALNVL